MKKNKLKVSIIIPAKNAEKKISLCLKSIKDLDYAQDAINIYVIDNGSSDATVKVAKNYGCKVFIDSTKTVAGLRNVGAINSCSEIICFLDSDMIVDKTWLKGGLQLFQNNKIGCVTGPLKIPKKSSWIVKTWALNRDYSKISKITYTAF